MPRRELSLGVVFTGSVDPTFLTAIRNLQQGIASIGNASKQTSSVLQAATGPISTFRTHIKGLTSDIKELLTYQMRWYGAKAILFAMFDVPLSAAKGIISYAAEIDNARADMLRWGATSGVVTKDMISQNEMLIQQIRKMTTMYPVAFKDLKEAVESFVGAGIPITFIQRMVEPIAQLKAGFKEIDMKQFAVAITGAWKTLKDKITGAKDEVDAFRMIIEKLLLAQKEGIIRPENFAVVLQYLTNVGDATGLSLDRLIAMSVAITDTGVKAASAARLTASFIQGLQSTKGIKALEAMGIQFDKNKQLGGQFDSIVIQLNKTLNLTGEASMLAFQWLDKLFGKEQARVFVAYVKSFERMLSVEAMLKNLVNGLMTVSDVMKQPFPKQWEMFKGVLNEIGQALIQDGGFLRTFMANLLDVGRGILYAMDSTGKYNDQISKLGSAGKIAYGVVDGLGKAFSTLGSFLSGIIGSITKVIGYFVDLTGSVSSLSTIVQFFATVVMGMILSKMTLWVIGLGTIGRGVGVLAGILATFTSGGLTTFGLTLTVLAIQIIPMLISKLGTLGAVISAVLLGIGLLYKTPRDVEKETAVWKMKASTQSGEEVGVKIGSLEKEIADKQAEINRMKEKYGPGQGISSLTPAGLSLKTNPLKDDILWLNRELEVYKKQQGDIAKASKDSAKAKKDAAGGPPPPIPGKDKKVTSYDRSISELLEQERKAKLAQDKLVTDDEIKELDRRHKLNLLSDGEYYAQKSALTQAFADKEIIELDRVWQKEREPKLLKDIRETSGDEKEAAKAKYRVEYEQYVRDFQALKSKEKNAELDENFRREDAYLKSLAADNQFYITSKTKRDDEYYTNLEWLREEDSKNNQTMFDRGEISAVSYYDKLKKLSKTRYDNENSQIDARIVLIKQDYDNQLELAGQNAPAIDAINKARTLKIQEEEEKRLGIKRKYASDIVETEKKMIADINAIYQSSGTLGVWKEFLNQMYAETQKKGEAILGLFKGIASDMKSSLSGLFYDMSKGNIDPDKKSKLANIDTQMANLNAETENVRLTREQISANEALTESERTALNAALDARQKQIDAQKELLKAQQDAVNNSKDLGEVFQSFLDSITKKMFDFMADQMVNDFFALLSGKSPEGKTDTGKTSFVEIVKTWSDKVKGLFTDMKTSATDGMADCSDAVQSGMGSMLEDIDGKGVGIVEGFSKIWSNVWDSTTTWLGALGESVSEYLKDIWKAVSGFLAQLAAAGGGSGGGAGGAGGGAGEGNPWGIGEGAYWHSGGKVGNRQGGVTKRFPTSLFQYAPRLHGGLRADEYPAILQRGETVIPAGQSESPQIGVFVNVQNRTGLGVVARSGNLKKLNNGKTQTKNIILDLMSTDYGFRGAMG